MFSNATRAEAYDLLHEGLTTMVDMEHNGIAVDTEYCEKTMKELDAMVKDLRAAFEKTELMQVWRKVYGRDLKWDGNDQLADVLFNHMKFEPIILTESGKPGTSEEALLKTGAPGVRELIRMRKMQKCRNTYLKNILREAVDGYIHPSFNLHTVRTYRSSCNAPNFQNMPIRDPEQGALIRRAIIPRRPDWQITELDFKGNEVRVGACYHKDPKMLKYIKDPTTDMHRDMACECYLLREDQISKPIRHCGKNGFVFPEFYGATAATVSVSLWEAIDADKLITKDGILVGHHMTAQGIQTLSAFTKHIEKVEHAFWHERFNIYRQWKEEWFSDYLRRGYFDMFTGFRCGGVMSFNDAVNYPVQGAAFHCLLWVLNRTNAWLKAEGFETLLIGQIHDSMVLDGPPSEREEVIAGIRDIVQRQLLTEWKWLIVPMDVEAKVAPPGGSWFEIKEAA